MGVSKIKQPETKLATLEQLKKKPVVTKHVTLIVTNDDGENEEVSLKFKAIGNTRYDQLVIDHPPTSRQKKDGHSYNMTTFAPALLAVTCAEPKMSEEDWTEIFESEEWNRGELANLFMQAVMVNTQGLELVDPTEPG
jgi:hypothetical protein